VLKLLAIEIDGTLLDSSGRIPEANREALGAAAAAGVHLALVTGRSLHFTRHVAEDLGVPVTLVVNNGAIVRTPDGRTPMRRLLDRAVARDVLEATRAYDTCVAVVVDREPGADSRPHVFFEHMDWTHPQRRHYYEQNRAFIARASPLAGILTEDPIEVMFTGHVEPMRAVAATLCGLPGSARYSTGITEYEQRDFSLVNVNAAVCSKGRTLADLTAALGLTREQVMAVGDNLNDLEMLRFAGTPVVMGNAAEPLRRLGFHVTDTNDDVGLATAIERFVLKRGHPCQAC
jgi:Cof subfamily protein (haloacid dehalogenase superfamily)